MNSFKGFASIPALANNASGSIAQFGELSNYSHTFSRQKTNWANIAVAPNVEVVGFTTKTDVGAFYSPTPAVINHILSVCEWIYGQHVASAIPSSATTFEGTLGTQFPAMTTIEINEILLGSPTTKRMPDYVKWRFDDGGTISEIQIWFADSRFRTQYDDYEILLVPPLTDINVLNNPITVVQPQLAAVTTGSIISALGILVGDQPATIQRSFAVTWADPSNPGATLPTEWYLAIYGQAGNDNDAIKDAIREYIAAESTATNWPNIYPALYSNNEFCIMPLWNDVAVAGTVLDPTLYRSFTKVNSLKSAATALIPDTYETMVANISTYLNNNLYVASAFWRTLMFMVVGNPSNVGAQYDFAAKFPDYIDVQTSSPDFLRMTLTTQNFIIALNAALEKAMDLTLTSPVPPGYSRVVRSGRVFLSFDYDGFSYLVLAKISNTIVP